MSSSGAHPASDRLDGWKEIATYLKRSVRTVQRWEAQLRLPVRRLTTGQAESVYAIAAELDAWLASSVGRRRTAEEVLNGSNGAPAGALPNGAAGESRSAAPPAAAVATAAVRSRPHAWLAAAMRMLVIAAVGVTWLAGGFRPGAAHPPDTAAGAGILRLAALAVDGHALVLLDKDGNELGRHVFSGTMKDLADPERRARFSVITDLDDDGTSEVIVARPILSDSLVSVLNADGSVRFHLAQPRTPSVGGAPAPLPGLVPSFVFVPEPSDGTFFVAAHVEVHSIAALLHLDAQGRLLHEYWCNGYIESMSQQRMAAGVRTFVGSIDDETGGAALAVFDGPPSGAAPVRHELRRCVDCPAGWPIAYFVFPQSRLQRRLACMAAVTWISVRPEGVLAQVQLGDVCTKGARPEDAEFAYYDLNRNLEVMSASVGNRLPTVLNRLTAERRGGLTAADRYRGEADLFPVLRWTAARSGWDRIDAAAPSAAAARSR